MQTGQFYRLDLSEYAHDKVSVGDFVFLSADSDEVVGFISSVDTNELHSKTGLSADFCLFKQSANVEDGAIVIQEKLTFADLSALVYRTIVGSDDAKSAALMEEWIKVLKYPNL